MLDALFAIAGSGADGVNIQTAPWPGTPNEIFYFHRAGSGRAERATEYYGALMFAQAAPPGSRLLGLGYAGGSQIRVWATLTPGHQIHLVAINASLTHAASIHVRLPTAAPATVSRLLASRCVCHRRRHARRPELRRDDHRPAARVAPDDVAPPVGRPLYAHAPASSAAMLTVAAH